MPLPLAVVFSPRMQAVGRGRIGRLAAMGAEGGSLNETERLAEFWRASGDCCDAAGCVCLCSELGGRTHIGMRTG